ncbi:MAG: SDR family oxidoreductase [Myxococcales bacterium]|nr:SDR family oxidoreductase [Myxococcales bacterium]
MLHNAGRLSDEVAVVTGSTSGLGAAIARRFVEEGASVLVTGRNVERGEALLAELAAAPGRAAFVAADLAEEEACTRLVDGAVERFGALTVLVNNAVASDALASDGSLAELSTEAWEAVLRVGLSAPMWLCRAAIPHMQRAGRGSIVNISSRAAERATPAHTAYVACKGGLNALTRAIATDYAGDGIRCNTLAPGYIVNERRERLSPERRAHFERMHLTRLASAQDVAAAALYLASRESEVVTGILLPVDGGSSTAARASSFG